MHKQGGTRRAGKASAQGMGLVPFLEWKLVQGVQGKKVKCQTAPAGGGLGSLTPQADHNKQDLSARNPPHLEMEWCQLLLSPACALRVQSLLQPSPRIILSLLCLLFTQLVFVISTFY